VLLKHRNKLKIDLPFKLAIALLCMYPKECKSIHKKDTCTFMFITALFTIAKLEIAKEWKIFYLSIYLSIYLYISKFSCKEKMKLCHLQENGWYQRSLC
jgi:hypothetical protein